MIFDQNAMNEKNENQAKEKKKICDALKTTRDQILNSEQEMLELKDGLYNVTVDRDKITSKLDDRDEELVQLREKYEEVYQSYCIISQSFD